MTTLSCTVHVLASWGAGIEDSKGKHSYGYACSAQVRDIGFKIRPNILM